jgi:predicted transposase YdaD
MSDFFATDAHQIHNKLLSERVKFFKETEEGKREMSGIEQEIAARNYSEGVNAVVRKLLLRGASIETIAEVSDLPVEKVMAMKEALKKDGQELPRKQ